MTSLISSSLITLSNETLLPTVNDSSSSTSPPCTSDTTILLRTLSCWVNTRIGNNTIEQFDRDFRDGSCLNKLMTWLQQQEYSLPRLENNSLSTRQDHLSNVARIIDTLLEYDNTTTNQYPSALVHKLESAIGDGHVDITLELVSCIILNLWMKPILLNEHITTWSNQVSIYIAHATIPTFQLYQLTFQRIYTEVGSTLLSWVNWQLQNRIGNHDVDLIHDFGSSWKSGLAFTLLVYCQNESILSDDLQFWLHQQLQTGNEGVKWAFNGMYDQTYALLSLVFDIANKHMGVPLYLKPGDLLDVDSVNEWCVILYVYEFYLYSSQQQQSPSITVSDDDIRQALMEVQAISHATNEKGALEPLHPLDVIDNRTIDLYSQKMAKVRSLWSIYSTADHMERQKDQQLADSIDSTNKMYDLFNCGQVFVKISHAIQIELQVVENDTKSTMTTEAIQQLESRMCVVQSSLSGMEEEFSSLLQQSRYNDHLHQVYERYRLVCTWVDQVRIWMTEADRIRGRIGNWIDLIDERNSHTDHLELNALCVVDVTSLDHLDVMTLYNEHEQLKRDIDRFEADDMTRLRAHVKQRTNDQDEHRNDLTPADTSTIEITLITLNMLHRLLQLVADRGQWIECLVHRLKWEHLFEKGVEWIFAKDNQLQQFLHDQALWRGEDDEGYNVPTTASAILVSSSSMKSLEMNDGKETAELIIGGLIQLEQDISGFDRGSFMDVLDAYQEMEGLMADSSDDSLPGFLEKRQAGFEGAFEDLMKRCCLARKVVEQHLVMMDVIAQYKNIKFSGETLRRRLLADNDGLGDSGLGVETGIGKCTDDNNLGDDTQKDDNNAKNNSIETCVHNFKEASADFLTHAKTRIPYPDVPIMLTAMGSHDSTDIGVTNDAILSALHTYGMSLALIADGLDQLLMERQHIHSLQRRVKHACEQLARFTDWMNERLHMVAKSDFDIYMGNDSKQNDTTTFTTQLVQDKDEELVRLEKERDTIASRIQQMEHDELAKLLDSVNVLETDIDSANTVVVDRHALVNALQNLECARANLNTALVERAHKLDVLKKHIEWVAQWIKTHQWVLSTIRKLWDFCMKKAKYDPAIDSLDTSSASGLRNITNALRAHQDRITENGERQMTLLADSYKAMVDGMNDWVAASRMANQDRDGGKGGFENYLPHADQTVYDFTSKQSMVVQKYRSLVQLSQYASKLVAQRSTVEDVLVQVYDASREGERLRDSLTKSTRRMMEHDLEYHHNNSQTQPTQQQTSFEERIESFHHLITTIKKHYDTIGFPLFTARSNDPGFHSIFSSLTVQQSQQTDIKNLLTGKMDQLVGLGSLLDNLLGTYSNTEKRKRLVLQYCENALELDRWIQEQIAILKNRQLDVAAETLDYLLKGKTWTDLANQHQLFESMVNGFETDQLKNLHDKVATLMNDILASSSETRRQGHVYQQQQRRSVDMTLSMTQNLGTTIENFALLKQGVIDEAITMDAVKKRIEWSDVLQDALRQLESIQARLSTWCMEKDQWISTDDFFGDDDVQVDHSPVLAALYQDLEHLMWDKDEFTKSVLPKVHQFYDTFIQCFAKLPRPAATPDHIEGVMSSLDRSSIKFHEALGSKNRELDIIQDCIHWEADWKALYLAIQNCRIGLESFVSESARWRPQSLEFDQDVSANGNHVNLLDNSQRIHQQCATADQQLLELRTRLNDLQNVVSTNNVNNIILKSLLGKLGQAEYRFKHVYQLAQFLDLVMKQNAMMQDVQCRIAEISGELKLVLDEYKVELLEINGTPNNGTTQDDETNFLRLSTISNQHTQLTKDIGQLRSDVSDIIYPVRPTAQQIDTDYQRLNGDGDFCNKSDDDFTALDNDANAKIRDFVTSGLTHLDNKLLDLGRIILAGEQRSKWFATLRVFKQQLKSSDGFFNAQKSKLYGVIAILETDLKDLNAITKSLQPIDGYLSTVENALLSTQEVDKLLRSNHYMLADMGDINDRCLDYMHIGSPAKAKEELQDLGMIYNHLVDDWKQLESKAHCTISSIQNDILPSLVTSGITQLLQKLTCLELEIQSQHYSTVSNEQYDEWMKKLQSLRQKHSHLRTSLCGGISAQSVPQSHDANTMIGQIEASLRIMKIKIDRWRQIELQQQKIDAFVCEATSFLQSLTAFQQSTETIDFTNRTSDSTLMNQHLKTSYRQIMDDIQRLEYTYSNLLDNHSHEYQPDDDDFALEHQQLNMDQMESIWGNVQTANSLVAHRMKLIEKWWSLHGEMNDARQTIFKCKTTLEAIILCGNNPSDTDKKKPIDNVEKQLHTTLSWLTCLPSELDQVLLDDKFYNCLFQGYYRETLDSAKQVEKLLQEHYLAIDGARLVNTYQDALEQRQQLCLKQKSTLEQYDERFLQLCSQLQLDEPLETIIDNIRNTLTSHRISLDHIRSITMESRMDLQSNTGDIKMMYERLTNELGRSCREMDDLQQPLLHLLDTLDDIQTRQQVKHQLLGPMVGYLDHVLDLLNTASQLHNRLLSLETGDIDSYSEAQQQHADLKESIDQFVPFTSSKSGDRQNEQGISDWLHWLDQQYNNVMQTWTQCCDAIDKHELQLRHLNKKQNDTQIEKLINYVNDVKNRVDSLHLSSNQNMVMEYQELGEIEKEFFDTLCPKINNYLKEHQQQVDLGEMPIDVAEGNSKGMVQHLHTSLQESKFNLEQAIGNKKADAQLQKQDMHLMDGIDELETVIGLMEESVAAAAPCHSRIVDGAFVKSDLQDLLSGLIKAYKTHSLKVGSLFEQIQGDYKKSSTEKTTMQLLASSRQHWTKIKESATARERELQTCIEQLQHDFFTKLAIIGKTQQRHHNQQSYSSLLPPPPSSATYSGQVNRENSLNAQIEQVLKDQPYQLKVKVVPGQVGKYWIGDTNPRLVYCRILKSKLVMVRVGGGWVELSQYLLEHGCCDGTVIPSNRQMDVNSRFGEAFIHLSNRSVSPSGRVTLRGGGGLKYTEGAKSSESSGSLSPSRTSSKTSTSTRCRSPMAGYTDGDCYVRVDEAGNHLALKMTRVDDNYFIPFQQAHKSLYYQ